MTSREKLLMRVKALQDGLIAEATGGEFDGGNPTYERCRSELMSRPALRGIMPSFIKMCGDLGQFWEWIKFEEGTYAARRVLIWDAFRPLIHRLENDARMPSDDTITSTLKSLDATEVEDIWQRALERRSEDPGGAITLARSLVESVCKHILDALSVEYDRKADMPKLWSLVAAQLNLAPRQHEEEVFRSILGNCQAVVGNLASIRNKLSDAHGQGRRPVRPQPRHAQLVVNLSGSMASFLVATWEQRRTEGKRQ